MGAQWIHGKDNDLYEFSVTKDLANVPDYKNGYIPEYGEEKTGTFITEDGKIAQSKFVRELIDHLDEEQDMMYDAIRKDQNVYEYFKEKFDDFITSQNEVIDDETMELLKAAFRWFVIFELVDNSCNNLQNLSALSYLEWVSSSNEDLIYFKRNYSSVVEELAKEFPINELIRYKTAVNKIELIHPHPNEPEKLMQVKLSTVTYKGDVENINFANKILFKNINADDIESEQVNVFDNVIVTSSIGFLKENLDMFAFKLPKNKTHVIHSLGFGFMNKIFLYFEKPFWDPKGNGFQTLWLNVEDENSYFYKTGKRSYKDSEFPEWVYCIQGFDLVRCQPKCLMAWIASYGAQQIETLSDEEISSVLGSVLRKIVPPSCAFTYIENPTVITSRWRHHPYIRGAYSNRTIEYQKLPLDFDYNIDELAEPIHIKDLTNEAMKSYEEGDKRDGPLISFAGEATDRTHYSTVDGAMHSGEREAARLLTYYNKW